MTYLDKAKQRFNEGVRLSEQRDSGKRKFEKIVCYRAANPRRLRHTQNAQRTRKSIRKETPTIPRQNDS